MKRTLITAGALALIAVPAAHAQKPEPKNITIAPNNGTVKFGGAVTLSGKLTGSNNSGRTVMVEADPFPFDNAFTNLDPNTTTNASGDWTFATKPTVNTHYRARSGNAESKTVEVFVRPAITLTLSDSTPAAGSLVRFSGRLCPEHDGIRIALQRRFGTKWRTIRRPLLKDIAGENCSSYSKQIRVRKDSVWRAHFNADADHVEGNSRRRRVNVH
jgi:serine protease